MASDHKGGVDIQSLGGPLGQRSSGVGMELVGVVQPTLQTGPAPDLHIRSAYFRLSGNQPSLSELSLLCPLPPTTHLILSSLLVAWCLAAGTNVDLFRMIMADPSTGPLGHLCKAKGGLDGAGPGS